MHFNSTTFALTLELRWAIPAGTDRRMAGRSRFGSFGTLRFQMRTRWSSRERRLVHQYLRDHADAGKSSRSANGDTTTYPDDILLTRSSGSRVHSRGPRELRTWNRLIGAALSSALVIAAWRFHCVTPTAAPAARPRYGRIAFGLQPTSRRRVPGRCDANVVICRFVRLSDRPRGPSEAHGQDDRALRRPVRSARRDRRRRIP